jgi:hypothetical protein
MIRSHVESFYKDLFKAEIEGSINLEEGFWDENNKLTVEEAADLSKPFTIKEIEEALKDMDSTSAPGPDGFPVGFYRAFWPDLKALILEMFSNFHRGDFNMRRLNYGMISLVPNLKEANNIRQYRPICVLNIDYKWFTKVLTMRLIPMADKLIGKNQTAFILGRFILEGVIILHEILHELRVSKTKGIVLKLDFEKAYDKVCYQGDLVLTFRRNFGCREDQELVELTELVAGVSFSENKDTVKWVLEKSGRFTTSSMYKNLTFIGFLIDGCNACGKLKFP